MKVVAGLCLACSLLSSCGLSDAKPKEACRNAGYAIANRIYDCFGGDERANEAYEQFIEDYSCQVTAAAEGQFACATAINGLSCEAVLEAEGNTDELLLASPVCAEILARADGLGPWIDGSNVSQGGNEICYGVVTAVDGRMTACNGGVAPDPTAATVLSESYQCIAEYLAGALPTELLACASAIDAAECTAAPGNSVAEWLAVSDICDQVYTERE